MSSGPVATAFVKIRPDASTFQKELQAAVNKAVKNLNIPNVTPGVRGGGGGGGGGGGAAGVGTAAASAKLLANESNALRGSLIGLSRVTPVTVFGLGLYGTAALAAGTAIKSAVRSTADFEHQLNIFQATTNATVEEMARIEEKAKQLGSDLSLPATSAGDAARAMTELAKSGLSVEDTLAGATGVLQLSAAANLEQAEAAEFVATQLNAFGLAGKDATHVADLLAGASIAAQGEIRDFGNAFQQVGAVARQVDLDIETTTGALTELAKAGLRGADGGTSLRTTLLRLAPTTKQAADYMEALGIRIDKTKTIGDQLPNLLDQYRAALTALTPVQQQQALAQIFGQDAIRAASILIRGGSEALRDNTAAANQNGAAARLAGAHAKGLSGAFSGLKSNLDTLGITLGGLVSGPMTDFLNSLSDVTSGVTTLAEKVADFGKGEPGSGKKGALANFLHNTGPGQYQQIIDFAKLVHSGELSKIRFGETPIELFKRLHPNQSGPTQSILGHPEEGLRGPGPGGIQLSEKELAAIRARTARLNEDRKKRKPLPGDTQPTNKLEAAQLNAQLNDDLQAELKADRAIEDYFEKRLDLAKEGTDRYNSILGAFQQAHSATESVQNQIDAVAEAAAADRKAKDDERKQKAEKEAADAAQAAKDLFNLQKSRLDLVIDAAGLTKGIGDDIRANRAEIRFFNAQIKRIEAIRKRRKLTLEEQQAVVDYRTAIIGLRATIQSLKDSTKSSSGFTLDDLFKEAVQNFNEFGSNVSSSPMTPGQAGRTVFAAHAANFSKLSQADRMKLEKAAETNTLLAQILDAVTNPKSYDNLPIPGGAPGDRHYLSPGVRASLEARRVSTKIGSG